MITQATEAGDTKAQRPQAYDTFLLLAMYVLTLLSVWVAQSIYAANASLIGIR